MSESDPIPLDGDPELDVAERLWVRKAMREEERMRWAQKKLRWVAVSVVSLAGAGWAAYEWLRAHVVLR